MDYVVGVFDSNYGTRIGAPGWRGWRGWRIELPRWSRALVGNYVKTAQVEG